MEPSLEEGECRMSVKEDALRELDRLLTESEDLVASFKQFQNDPFDLRSGLPEPILWRFYTSCVTAICRFAGRESEYGLLISKPDSNRLFCERSLLEQLVGVLMSLRDAVDCDLLGGMERRVRSNTYADFLTQAEELLKAQPSYHVAAMVLIGGVLEDHLRKLCEKHNVQWKGREGMSAYNDALKETAYPQLTWRRIQAVADQRNAAAHGGADAAALKPEAVEDALAWTTRFIEEHGA
jgi:hypothetical protein